MSKMPFVMVLVLAALMAGSASAADTSDTTPASAPTASTEVLPDEITGRLTPEPTYKYGVQNGPCTVSVTCIGNYTVSCYGDTVCYWRVDGPNPYSRGFVECDGSRLYCQ